MKENDVKKLSMKTEKSGKMFGASWEFWRGFCDGVWSLLEVPCQEIKKVFSFYKKKMFVKVLFGYFLWGSNP